MIPCKNKDVGCSQWFETTYGMSRHIRYCTYSTTERPSKRRKERMTNGNRSVPHPEFRLQIDRAGFESHDPTSHWNIQSIAENILEEHEFSMLTPFLEESPSAESKLTKLLKIKLGRLGRKASRSDIEEIIKILRNPVFSFQNFINGCNKYEDCLAEEQLHTEESLGALDFVKTKVKDVHSEFGCDVFIRSPVEVLREQIRGASKFSTFFDPAISVDQEGTYSHPMMASIGKEGVEEVRKAVMSRMEEHITWNDPNTSMEASFAGLVQVYSDKSCTSLKESSFQFHPLHVTLLNFSEEYRRNCIVNGKTFTAFLPIWFFRDDSPGTVHENCTRVQKLRLFHLCLDRVLIELKMNAYSGFSCDDKEKTNRKCHPCLTSYCCDLPETKMLTSVKNGNRSQRNCHRCLAETTTFNKYSRSELRTGKDTNFHINSASTHRKNGAYAPAEEILTYYSLTEQIPSLSTFPFVGIHPTLDYNAIFTFESLHGFHLGVSKTLKACLSQRLRSEELFTRSIPTKNGKQRLVSFSGVRMTILNGINRMLSHIHHTSPAKGLNINFTTSRGGSTGNGLYKEGGKLVGMLQGKDYKSIDMIFPFIGMFLDRCCDEERRAPSTTVFVQYVEIMQEALSYQSSPSWTERRVERLEQRIKTFKNNAVQLYAEHHPSALCTEKFHMLDHIGQDIRRTGGLNYGDAGLYEYTHTLVKQAYRSGSKRKSTGLYETLDLFMKEMSHSHGATILEPAQNERVGDVMPDRISSKRFLARLEAKKTDCATLVKQGELVLLNQLERARFISRKIRKATEGLQEMQLQKYKHSLQLFSSTIRSLISQLGEEACRVLQKLIRKIQLESDTSHRVPTSTSFSIVKSGWVSGINTPTLVDYDRKKNRILMKEDASRSIQRFVCANGFHSTDTLRQDCVLIEGHNNDNTANVSLWVAKLLTLLRFNSLAEGDQYSSSTETEYMFVQYFDTIRPEDAIDKCLGCICLKWAEDENDKKLNVTSHGSIDPHRRWYDLLPVSSIRGVVHTVRRDYGKYGLGTTQDIQKVPWHKESFFINRFYSKPQKAFYKQTEEA